ncbi:FecR/PupR family sigma factor regulator, partial [Alloalcanivorax marinus]|uniref:FecR/PupR family sigma factor regulator n=1 Tax=Alloalcanivorax marinus TaxID=1177169 RepID=UPI0021D0339E
MEHSDKPADDALLREASDWKLRLDEAPQDPALRRACADWRARDERHENAWRRVSEAWALIGDLPVQRQRWPGHGEAPASHRRWPRGAALALAACLLLALLPA